MEPLTFDLGDKIMVLGTNKIGRARFIGSVPFSDGIWVGLELNDASGRNDGSVQGRRYFSCKPRYGLFVRAQSCVKANTNITPSPDLPSKPTVEPNNADMMLSRIQCVLGSTRKQGECLISMPTEVDSTSASCEMISDILSKLQANPNFTDTATMEMSARLLIERVAELPAFQNAIKAAISTHSPPRHVATSSEVQSSDLARLEARVATLEIALENITSSLDRIQHMVSVRMESSTPISAPNVENHPTNQNISDASNNDTDVLKLKEALQIACNLTRDAQNGIQAERAKRKEETEALLSQLAKYKSPNVSPSR